MGKLGECEQKGRRVRATRREEAPAIREARTRSPEITPVKTSVAVSLTLAEPGGL